MAEDRPNLSKEEVKQRAKEIVKDKPDYKSLIRTVLNEMKADHGDTDREDPAQVNVKNLNVNLGKLGYLKREKLFFKPIDTHTWKVWECTNRQAMEEALQEVKEMEKKEEEIRETQPVGEVDLSALDKLIEVRPVDAKIKKVLRRAVKKSGVHIAFVGPPGTGKSLVADIIEELPRSMRVPGTDVTRASLRDGLMEKRSRFLVFDEIDKVKGTNAMDAVQLLSQVMEEQVLSVQVKGKEATVKLPLNVFGFGNRFALFPSNIKDRFLPVHMREYTDGEFRELVTTAFPKYENIGRTLARAVVDECLKRGVKSYRKARSIAKIAETPSELNWVFETFEFDEKKLEGKK